MSEQQQNIINELLKAINDSKEVGDMSFSTGNELISLVRLLQVS